MENIHCGKFRLLFHFSKTKKSILKYQWRPLGGSDQRNLRSNHLAMSAGLLYLSPSSWRRAAFTSQQSCYGIFMKDWKSRLPDLIDRTDKLSDSVRSRLRKITGFNDPLIIIPYLGYGTADKLSFGGRILEDEGFTPATSADRTWRNLINMYKRFETDEVPGARIRARFQGIESEVITDHEGYFSFEIQPVQNLNSHPWQEVELELLDPPSPKERPVRATARVLVPSAAAKFGIISDIDDTVISSNVLNKLKMILTVILSNEHTRKPFEGVAALYRALQGGASGGEDNPIFYVSNSAVEPLHSIARILERAKDPVGSAASAGFWRSRALCQGSNGPQEAQHQNDFGLISASVVRADWRQR